MENKPSNLREPLWRRKLSDAERAGLRAQPELELEARLTDALGKIPDASVPSNFTARVLDAIELEESRTTRSQSWTWNWHWLLPRAAVAASVLVFAGVGIQRYEIHSQRAQLARNVALVAVAQSLPSTDALENLDAIQRMGQSGSHVDGE
ncbi:MAG TPA: hypothetical protein VGI63_03870, partial [Verrucomicrobiae bacterium]